MSIDGESTWEVIVKEYVTDADGNLPVIESENSAAVLILIPRIDVEAYNQAVANNEILEEGNSHRLHSTDKPQSALPTVKTDSKPDSDKTVVAAIPATNSSVTNAVQTKPLAGGKSSALDAAAHDDVKSKQPKPKQSPNLDWNDIYVAMKRLGWEHVYETSFAYAKQFFTQPKLPVQPLASSTPIKAGEPRKQVIGSSLKKEDAKGLKAKEAVTTAVEPAIKKVEVGEDAPWMKFAIEEQGKSGVNKVTEITDSHFSNSEWRLQHKERASAENEIKERIS